MLVWLLWNLSLYGNVCKFMRSRNEGANNYFWNNGAIISMHQQQTTLWFQEELEYSVSTSWRTTLSAVTVQSFSESCHHCGVSRSDSDTNAGAYWPAHTVGAERIHGCLSKKSHLSVSCTDKTWGTTWHKWLLTHMTNIKLVKMKTMEPFSPKCWTFAFKEDLYLNCINLWWEFHI